jgi:hypothetical protein
LVNCEERKRHVDSALDMIDGMHLLSVPEWWNHKLDYSVKTCIVFPPSINTFLEVPAGSIEAEGYY